MVNPFGVERVWKEEGRTLMAQKKLNEERGGDSLTGEGQMGMGKCGHGTEAEWKGKRIDKKQ
jgi:hypothetical protein